MQNMIQLLPDAIANQIAAGEVVQRPASVVKELMENAVDAGAGKIDLRIKDAGKALIQVSDDGCGMSAQDARMSFERHATSKIRTANDLFHIRTMGFRGEALASIAAVAQVKLRTRLHDDELGTEIDIAGSEIQHQEPCVTPPGTIFQVKNLFYNVPARRNFLKSNPVEIRHITQEFIHIALSYPELHLSFTNNQTQVYELPASTLEQRIVAVFGNSFSNKLIAVEESTGYANIKGYIGQTSLYRKNRGEQFFFVNRRFIKSAYLHHAVQTAYQDFIPTKTHPFYCIQLDIDPEHLDVNIHPTKTEVKFDDEKTLYVLLHSIIKRGLAEAHEVPVFDFSESGVEKQIYQPNPSSKQGEEELTIGNYRQQLIKTPTAKPRDWEEFYRPNSPERSNRPVQPPIHRKTQPALFPQNRVPDRPAEQEVVFLVPFHQSYLLVQRGGQLYILHQHRAHQRILFERLMTALEGKELPCQQLLFPQTLELSPMDASLLLEAETVLAQMGFELKEFGKNTLIVYGTPAGIPTGKVRDIFEQILVDLKEMGTTRVRERVFEQIALAIATRSAVTSTQKLSTLEMEKIAEELFQCEVPGTTPRGQPIFRVISAVELEQFFG